jgi:glucose-1-phosphate thymidylyltransferase
MAHPGRVAARPWITLSKQVVSIKEMPTTYQLLSTLMLAGIREVLVITSPTDQPAFERLLGDGSPWGMEIRYAVQLSPDGLVPAALVLGDNLFHGHDLIPQLQGANGERPGATVFAYPVSDPERYGVVVFSGDGRVLSIEEKPAQPRSRYAVTGLYFYDHTVGERARQVRPSPRVELMGRGMAWLNTGTLDSLHETASCIRTLEKRQGPKVGCPEEVAWRLCWIDHSRLERLALPLKKSGYGDYLLRLLQEAASDHLALEPQR